MKLDAYHANDAALIVDTLQDTAAMKKPGRNVHFGRVPWWSVNYKTAYLATRSASDSTVSDSAKSSAAFSMRKMFRCDHSQTGCCDREDCSLQSRICECLTADEQSHCEAKASDDAGDNDVSGSHAWRQTKTDRMCSQRKGGDADCLRHRFGLPESVCC